MHMYCANRTGWWAGWCPLVSGLYSATADAGSTMFALGAVAAATVTRNVNTGQEEVYADWMRMPPWGTFCDAEVGEHEDEDVDVDAAGGRIESVLVEANGILISQIVMMLLSRSCGRLHASLSLTPETDIMMQRCN